VSINFVDQANAANHYTAPPQVDSHKKVQWSGGRGAGGATATFKLSENYLLARKFCLKKRRPKGNFHPRIQKTWLD